MEEKGNCGLLRRMTCLVGDFCGIAELCYTSQISRWEQWIEEP
jgi:hypothetical protein